jgi:hypothetical protein
VARAGELTLVQVASCTASSGLAGIADVRWTSGRRVRTLELVASYSEWAVYRAMKVRVVEVSCGPRRSRRERERRFAEVASGEWRVASWGKKQIPRSADPSGAQKARYARNDNSRGVAALVMRLA